MARERGGLRSFRMIPTPLAGPLLNALVLFLIGVVQSGPDHDAQEQRGKRPRNDYEQSPRGGNVGLRAGAATG